MSMTVNDIGIIIEKLAPVSEAHEKDNVGLLVGDGRRNVSKVMTALDATLDVVKSAIEQDVDMIVTHHPVIFSPVSNISSNNTVGEKLLLLIENGIAVYSAHTNFDKAPEGLNTALGKAIGLKDIVDNEAVEASGYVKIGNLDTPLALAAFAAHVKKSLGLDFVHFAGKGEKLISKVAFCSGSGMSVVDEAMSTGADVFVTGDLKYHDAVDVEEHGFAVVDATHYGTEKIAVRVLSDCLKESVDDTVEIIEDRSQVNPIRLG